jgi:hypothetical protein
MAMHILRINKKDLKTFIGNKNSEAVTKKPTLT